MKKLFLLFLLLIIGCRPDLKAGKLVNKQFRPAYQVTVPVQTGSIKVGDIDIPIYGSSQQIDYPARWELLIENEQNGKMRQQWFDVSENMYNKYKEEDWVELND